MKRNILYIIGFLIIVSVYFIPILNKPTEVDASVSIGSGYLYKTASSSIGSATVPYRIVSGSNHILGSIIIGSSTAARIRVYDSDGTATSSATSTLILEIKAGLTEQVITLDTTVLRGVALDIPTNHNGSFTVTYR